MANSPSRLRVKIKMACPVERFPGLDALPGVRAAFLGRCPSTPVDTDRETALARIEAVHQATLLAGGFRPEALVRAEQVHGNQVALAEPEHAGLWLKGCDGLITNRPGLVLGIYVADCAAVFLVDPEARAIGLLHSGKKGTAGRILEVGVQSLTTQFGSKPESLVVVVSPCIRPPHYEIDFAADLRSQAEELEIGQFHDAGICTASHPEKYYSYRREMGKTGRMLALLSLEA